MCVCSGREAPAHADESGSGCPQEGHRLSHRDVQPAVREVVHPRLPHPVQRWHQQAPAVQVEAPRGLC